MALTEPTPELLFPRAEPRVRRVYDLFMRADPLKRKRDPRYETALEIANCYACDASLVFSIAEDVDGLTAESTFHVLMQLGEACGRERVARAATAYAHLCEAVYEALRGEAA